MNIPKCKECEYHKYTPVMTQSRGSIACSSLKDKHICVKEKGNYQEIYSSELKTSPKWCPERD